MNEINRLQQLAGILTEIKVNNPMDRFGGLSMEDFLDYKDRAITEFQNYNENIGDDEREEFDEYHNKVEYSENIQDIDEALLWLFSENPVTLDNFKKRNLKQNTELIENFLKLKT